MAYESQGKLNTFEQVVSFMEGFTNLERRTDKYSVRTYRLDRMQALMQRLGDPQDSYSTIHVAGSKGKGSTASFIAKGLEAKGFRVGLYMSPHVSDYRERFTLCGRFIDDATLIETGNDLKERLEGFRFCDTLGENDPTTFELYTAFAFILFKRMGCQWAVIETGLGGRLDATNILKPKACVITPIELEHTNILGDTIEKIAIEKSKITKPLTPVFVSPQKPEAASVFRNEAKAQKAPIHEFDDEVTELGTSFSNGVQKVDVHFKDGFSTQYELTMLGDVQAQNSALALMVLRSLGLYVPGETEKAFEGNRLPGRMESIGWERPLILDGAHTHNSMDHLLYTFRQLHPGKEGLCIFGAVEGKDHSSMAESILRAFDKVIVSRPGTFKKSDPKALYDLMTDTASANAEFKGKEIHLECEAEDALGLAKGITKSGEPILVCGSFYLAGAVKEALARLEAKTPREPKAPNEPKARKDDNAPKEDKACH